MYDAKLFLLLKLGRQHPIFWEANYPIREANYPIREDRWVIMIYNFFELL